MNIRLTDGFGKDKDLQSYTDKHQAPHSPHSYGPIYDLIFSSQLELTRRPLRVLEIGTFLGGSARGFLKLNEKSLSKYVCVDTKDRIKDHHKELMNNDERCQFYLLDAYRQESIDMLQRDCGNFDIIDDGPHVWSGQEFFFREYHQLLNENGVLICEDIKYKYLKNLIKIRNELGIYIIDLRHNIEPAKNADEVIGIRYKNYNPFCL
jgi:SAM-dependent methyltransferase